MAFFSTEELHAKFADARAAVNSLEGHVEPEQLAKCREMIDEQDPRVDSRTLPAGVADAIDDHVNGLSELLTAAETEIGTARTGRLTSVRFLIAELVRSGWVPRSVPATWPAEFDGPGDLTPAELTALSRILAATIYPPGSADGIAVVALRAKVNNLQTSGVSRKPAQPVEPGSAEHPRRVARKVAGTVQAVRDAFRSRELGASIGFTAAEVADALRAVGKAEPDIPDESACEAEAARCPLPAVERAARGVASEPETDGPAGFVVEDVDGLARVCDGIVKYSLGADWPSRAGWPLPDTAAVTAAHAILAALAKHRDDDTRQELEDRADELDGPDGDPAAATDLRFAARDMTQRPPARGAKEPEPLLEIRAELRGIREDLRRAREEAAR
jgi:hypothetical protein